MVVLVIYLTSNQTYTIGAYFSFLLLIFKLVFMNTKQYRFGYWWRWKHIDQPFSVGMHTVCRWLVADTQIGSAGYECCCGIFICVRLVFRIWLLITIENELCTGLFAFVTIYWPYLMFIGRLIVYNKVFDVAIKADDLIFSVLVIDCALKHETTSKSYAAISILFVRFFVPDDRENNGMELQKPSPTHRSHVISPSACVVFSIRLC